MVRTDREAVKNEAYGREEGTVRRNSKSSLNIWTDLRIQGRPGRWWEWGGVWKGLRRR